MDQSIAATASAYSQFSGVLAGFAFAGLVVYLSRGDNGASGKDKNIFVWHVAAATFFSLFSLASASFLFATLAGMSSIQTPKGQTPPYSAGELQADLLTYGIILALAVLALLYSIVLMVLQYDHTEGMTRYAYWALTIGGTAMVLRFLAVSARNVLSVNCLKPSDSPESISETCKHVEYSGLLSTPGIWLTLSLATSLVVLFTVAAQPDKDGRSKGIARLLTDKIVAPTVLVFGATLFVAIGYSLYTTTRIPGYEPSTVGVDRLYIGSTLIVALFTLMFGSVVAPRADVMMTRQTSAGEQSTRTTKSPDMKRSRAIRRAIAGGSAVVAVVSGIEVHGISGRMSLWLLIPVTVLAVVFLTSVLWPRHMSTDRTRQQSVS